jgi:lipopolysaccharide export system permease protein
MKGILPRYLSRQFLSLFVFSLLGAGLLCIVIDIVENVDTFIDAKAPLNIAVLYYIYYFPYFLVLATPVGSLLATVFSVGVMARNNEITAMKALGFSFYQMMQILLTLGLFVSLFSFVLSEGAAIPANQKKGEIRRQYLEKSGFDRYLQFRDLLIQDPPDKIINIKFFDMGKKTAYNVEIETFNQNRLVSRLDTDEMTWNGKEWVVYRGYQRIFNNENENAFQINQPIHFHFRFTPKELSMAQIKPDEMGFVELLRFIEKVRQCKGDVQRWLTDLYMRIAFPLSNVFIILLSAPLIYNRRKKSLAIGFGISLIISFLFFGCVILGQTMGHNKSMKPLPAAWLGNCIAGVCGLIYIKKTRK